MKIDWAGVLIFTWEERIRAAMNVGQFIRKLIQGFFFYGCGTVIVVMLAEEYIPGFGKTFNAIYEPVADIIAGIWGSGLGDWAKLLAESVVTAFVWPVVKVEHAIERYVLAPMGVDIDLPTNLDALQIVILSFIFWSILVTRTLRLAGLYNPFWNVEDRKRGLVLQWLLKLRDWREELTRFGKLATTKWASLMEVVSHRYCDGDIFLGRPRLFSGAMLRPVGIKTDKHFLTIGDSGSGKSDAALVPNLCLHRGSLLAVDLKGDLTAITGWQRGDKGLRQNVFVVDPYLQVMGKGYSAKYNPFDEMKAAENDPERVISYAAKIAEALVKPMSEKEIYWDNAARTFIRGVILYIFVREEEWKRNLLRLRELVMEGDVEIFEQAEAEGIGKKNQTSHDILLAGMMACKGEGAYGDAISSAAASIMMMGEGQRGSIVKTAQEQTALLDLPEIRELSGKSDFLLEWFAHGQISVFLVMPPNELKGAQGRWVRMFILLFIDMVMRLDKPLSDPVLLAIEEFPYLGPLEGIEAVAPVMRSRGVQFWAVAQDIAQLKATYPETWKSLVDGASGIQFIGVTHPETLDFIVERLGMQEVKSGPQVEVRPLLDAAQVEKFLAKNNKNQIVWFGSQRPMKLKLCPYYEYLPWWYYITDEFKDTPVREFWRRLIWRDKGRPRQTRQDVAADEYKRA